MRTFVLSSGAAALWLALHTLPAHAESHTFKLVGGESKVQFVSDAPLERITGATTRVSGELTLDPAAPSAARGTIRVPVASITTNNDLRDEHLRGDGWLDAARFPNVEFTLRVVSGLAVLPEGSAAKAEVRGTLTVHGVPRDLSTSASVRLSRSADAQSLRIQASFPVKLEEHKVSVPSMVRLKVAPVIQVNVDLHAHAAASAASASAAKPSEPVRAEPPTQPAKKPERASKPAASPAPAAAVEPSPAPVAPPPTPAVEPSPEPPPASVREAAPPATPERKVEESGCSVSYPRSRDAAALPLLLAVALWWARRRAARG